jgi:DNA mismatch repair protein MutS
MRAASCKSSTRTFWSATRAPGRCSRKKTTPPLDLKQSLYALRAAALALGYADATQPGRGVPRCRARFYRPTDHLQLDEATLRNLEIFESSMDRTREGSLIGVLDATRTAMGARLLRRMLATPLLDVAAIRRRQDVIELLIERPDLRDKLRQGLSAVHDLERLTSRVSLGVATPREMARLRASLEQLPQVAAVLADLSKQSLAQEPPELLFWPDDDLADVAQHLAAALVEDPPAHAREGGIFARGYDSELDELIDLCEGGKSSILEMEQSLRQRTNISSLKVRFNKAFGYFIEVTRSNLRLVPEDFQRKQTLVNCERFVTDELAEYETNVLSAEERRQAMEQQRFESLRRDVAKEALRLSDAADRIALLDVLCSLAHVAHHHGYLRPRVDDSRELCIEEGRHAVVERFMGPGEFVPNDVQIDGSNERLLILTGPNMSGKSTIMRQVALITLLAQVGSFVPARSARIGLVDRIFTRVGASDNLARGESTFMVEMRETSLILSQATARSLVVLDEIGRGTSTYDGISIAWAVAEHIHDVVQARTLFATHYHELCQLVEVKKSARNYAVLVQEWQGQVVFLRKLAPGGASRSYGIEVAKLAGLPKQVLRRAGQVLGALEGRQQVPGLPLSRRDGRAENQLGLFELPAPDDSLQPAAPLALGEPPEQRSDGTTDVPAHDEMIARLEALDIDNLTPLQALNALSELRAMLRTK